MKEKKYGDLYMKTDRDKVLNFCQVACDLRTADSFSRLENGAIRSGVYIQ